ncbi:MAG: hypothetical protein R3222_10765, partial [Balneolaceae bacterium]|nr:hypothetical protein [Balneolaceae bacterium]
MLLQVEAKPGITPRAFLGGQQLDAKHKEGSVTTYAIPLSLEVQSVLTLTSSTDGELPPLHLPNALA